MIQTFKTLLICKNVNNFLKYFTYNYYNTKKFYIFILRKLNT